MYAHEEPLHKQGSVSFLFIDNAAELKPELRIELPTNNFWLRFFRVILLFCGAQKLDKYLFFIFLNHFRSGKLRFQVSTKHGTCMIMNDKHGTYT